jgi:hypothetical protein
MDSPSLRAMPTPVALPPRTAVPPAAIAALHKNLKKSMRSCLVMVDNLSPYELRLESATARAGEWLKGYEPPSRIR